jgi:GcrA cell cycle regulator
MSGYGPANDFWTDERIALLKEHWANGWSGSHIARELGAASASAVIGKIHRLKLPARMTGARSPNRVAPRPVRIEPSKPSVPAAENEPDERETPDVPVEEPIAIVGARGAVAALLALRSHHCKFPIGDPGSPDFHFCAALRAHENTPYCPKHLKLATQPASVRNSVHARVSRQAVSA